MAVADAAPSLVTPPMPDPGRCIEIAYDGRVNFAGHFRRPGETRPCDSRRRLLVAAGGAARLDWSTWAPGDSAPGAPEIWIVTADSVWNRDNPAAPWRALAGERAEMARFQVGSGSPWLFVLDPHFAGAAKPVPSGGSPGDLRLSCPYGSALPEQPRTVNLGPDRSGSVSSAIDFKEHPCLGDTWDTAACSYFGPGSPAPQRLEPRNFERDHDWKLTDRLVAYRADADSAALLARPRPYDPPPADENPRADVPPVLHELVPGIWAADMPDINSRSLVAEFADGLAVIEASIGSANGERLVDAICALVAAGATIVTAPGNEALLRDLCKRPWTIAPDRLARARAAAGAPAKAPDIRTFRGRFELSDSTQQMTAVDIGARSDHTDEFVVFSLPRAGLVFEAEQGWVTVNGTLRAGRRAEGFLRTLDDERIPAAQLAQAFPMHDEPATLTRSGLGELIRKRKR